MSFIEKLRVLTLSAAFATATIASETATRASMPVPGFHSATYNRRRNSPSDTKPKTETPEPARDPATIVWAGLVSIFKKLPAGRKEDEAALTSAFQEYMFMKGGLTPNMYMRMSSLAIELGITNSDIDAVLTEQPQYPAALFSAQHKIATSPHLH